MTVTLWEGRPLTEYTRDELIEIIEQLLDEEQVEPTRLSILARIAKLP